LPTRRTEMHIPESVYRSEDFSSSRNTVFLAEIVCIMCTQVVGMAVDGRWPPVRTVLFQAHESTVLCRVVLNQLRCPSCGGNTDPTEVTTRLLRRERPSDTGTDDEPRRGRPPKWLVARRAAARARESTG